MRGPDVAHRSELSWDVGGTRTTFRAERSLHDRAEAIGSAFLLPAASARFDLELTDPVDPVWRAGAREIGVLARRWWGWRPPQVIAPTGPAREPADEVALCFTGGVDSFHSLIRGPVRPTALVYVCGYDVDVDDRLRLEHVVSRLREIAQATSLPLHVVETDLRQHPVFARASWEATHGGALAAAGHLLDVGTLLISASSVHGREHPWGTHPSLDRHWSSSRTRIRHVGFGATRFSKIIDIAGHPLVRDHLQVCWRRRGAPGNCGRCHKCVVTMVVLDVAGVLGTSAVFPGPDDLPERIDAIRESAFPDTLRRARESSTRPEVTAALTRLLARMPRQPPPVTNWGWRQQARARLLRASSGGWSRVPWVAARRGAAALARARGKALTVSAVEPVV